MNWKPVAPHIYPTRRKEKQKWRRETTLNASRFFPEAIIVGEQEIEALSSEKSRAAAQSGKQGVWLNFF
jgi:hypothetical protein